MQQSMQFECRRCHFFSFYYYLFWFFLGSVEVKIDMLNRNKQITHYQINNIDSQIQFCCKSLDHGFLRHLNISSRITRFDVSHLNYSLFSQLFSVFFLSNFLVSVQTIFNVLFVVCFCFFYFAYISLEIIIFFFFNVSFMNHNMEKRYSHSTPFMNCNFFLLFFSPKLNDENYFLIEFQ